MAASVVAALLLLGCQVPPRQSSQQTATSAATLPGTPTRSPTAEVATPPPLASAREAYVELADRINERGEALIARLRAATTLEEARAVWAELAALEQQFIAGLDAIEFPESIAAEAQAVHDMEVALVALMDRLAAAENDAAYQVLLDEYVQGQTERRETTNRLRAALELPPLSTPTPAAGASASLA